MEKLEITKEIGTCKEISTDYYFNDKPFEIKTLINFLVDAEINGATHVKFGGRTEWDNNNSLEELWIQPVEFKLESDEDLHKRIEEEKKRKEAIENEVKEKELKELKRLKAKYENSL